MRNDIISVGNFLPLAAVKYSLAIVIAAVAFTITTTVQAAEEKLIGGKFISVMKGNTISGRTEKGAKFNVYFLSGGFVTYMDATGLQDRGRWRMSKQGEVCLTWNNHREGKETCSSVTLEGQTVRWKSGPTQRTGYIRGTIASTFLEK